MNRKAPILRQDGDSLLLECSILPKAKEEKIVGRVGDTLKIKLMAAPTDGKANRALIRFLATECELASSRVSIVRGAGSRRKTLCLQGVSTIPPRLRRFLHNDPD